VCEGLADEMVRGGHIGEIVGRTAIPGRFGPSVLKTIPPKAKAVFTPKLFRSDTNQFNGVGDSVCVMFKSKVSTACSKVLSTYLAA